MNLGTPWPQTAAASRGVLEIGGCSVTSLVEEFGAPLYVYCAETLRVAARAYRASGADIVFACKANMTIGILRELRAAGLGIDISSLGEFAAARRAGFEPSQIVVHGNAKTDEENEAFVSAGCGLIVVDNAAEPARIAQAARRAGRRQQVLVRVTPGIEAGGHEKIVTGHRGSKFGLSQFDAHACVQEILTLPELEWLGPHVHLGSQIDDAAALASVVEWLASWCEEYGLQPALVDLGGGLGVAYGRTPATDPGLFSAELVAAAKAAFPQARIMLEPGRSIVAAAGITLYRVVNQKHAGDGTHWVALDAGMADNIRPALYGAEYTVCAATRLDEPALTTVSLAGRHCESGDVLLRDARLPVVTPGDAIAFAATGAYVQSMASTYNGAVRPAAVLVESGVATLLTRRETLDELLARDV